MGSLITSDPEAFTAGLLARLNPAPARVALLCASRIGDFICATPAFRALRAALPEAEITLIGLPFVRDLVSRSPHLDCFHEFPGYPGIAEQFFSAPGTLAFLQAMQERRFHLAVQMHGSGVYSNPFALMLGARYAAGFIRPGDAPGRLDAAYPWRPGLPAVRRPLELVHFLGAPPRGEHTEFPLVPQDHGRAAELLDGLRQPWIGLHPGAREPGKCWPLEHFCELAWRLQEETGGTIVAIGGPDEANGGRAIAAQTPHAVSLAGTLSLPVMGAVIARLSLLVTNDSAPAHIAYALGAPSITLFGRTDPREWGPPQGSRIHTVIEAPAGNLRQLRHLAVDDVVDAARRFHR